jgi:hypothetical protein
LRMARRPSRRDRARRLRRERRELRHGHHRATAQDDATLGEAQATIRSATAKPPTTIMTPTSMPSSTTTGRVAHGHDHAVPHDRVAGRDHAVGHQRAARSVGKPRPCSRRSASWATASRSANRPRPSARLTSRRRSSSGSMRCRH